MIPSRRVLFLCTGNSCRSQMAEAISNARFPEWRAFSAGVSPSGYVHPLAIQVLQELGIRHEGTSKPVADFRGQVFDLVVTVCDDASEQCPLWFGKGTVKHAGFRDPARAGGTPEDQLAFFRTIRDEIAAALPGLLI